MGQPSPMSPSMILLNSSLKWPITSNSPLSLSLSLSLSEIWKKSMEESSFSHESWLRTNSEKMIEKVIRSSFERKFLLSEAHFDSAYLFQLSSEKFYLPLETTSLRSVWAKYVIESEQFSYFPEKMYEKEN